MPTQGTQIVIFLFLSLNIANFQNKFKFSLVPMFTRYKLCSMIKQRRISVKPFFLNPLLEAYSVSYSINKTESFSFKLLKHLFVFWVLNCVPKSGCLCNFPNLLK